jgi:tRNA A37 threonylcarbamoyladenosine modification protein TsaB
VGVPTLEAIAHSAGVSEATVTLLPAGRGEVFAQMFSMSIGGVVTALDQPAHLAPIKAVERYMDFGGICWAGEGSQVYSNLIQEFSTKTGRVFAGINIATSEAGAWRIAPPPLNLAQHVASLAISRVARDDIQTAESLRAIYVRPSDAELK